MPFLPGQDEHVLLIYPSIYLVIPRHGIRSFIGIIDDTTGKYTKRKVRAHNLLSVENTLYVLSFTSRDECMLSVLRLEDGTLKKIKERTLGDMGTGFFCVEGK